MRSFFGARTSRTSVVMLLVAALLVGSAIAAGALVARTGGNPAADMQSLLDTWRARADVPAAVLATHDPRAGTCVVASGSPERGGITPTATDAQFRVASITKMFTATVVVQLVEEGRLGLEDGLSRFGADFPGPEVTVRQLLNHTSGIPDYARIEGLGPELLADRTRRWTSAEVLDLVAHAERDFTPGTDYSYSNTNYVLLAEVIRAVTGTSWAEQVHTRIVEPLDLEHTYAAGHSGVTTGLMPAYFDADNDGDQENIETGEPWPAQDTSEGAAGAIVSTAADLLTFGDALFRGDLLDAASLQAMTSETPFHARNSNYGLGVEISRPDYRTTIWGHGGFLPGFRTLLWYAPRTDRVIVVLTNDSRANPADLAELALRAAPPCPQTQPSHPG